jgi:hypothetical protein
MPNIQSKPEDLQKKIIILTEFLQHINDCCVRLQHAYFEACKNEKRLNIKHKITVQKYLDAIIRTKIAAQQYDDNVQELKDIVNKCKKEEKMLNKAKHDLLSILSHKDKIIQSISLVDKLEIAYHDAVINAKITEEYYYVKWSSLVDAQYKEEKLKCKINQEIQEIDAANKQKNEANSKYAKANAEVQKLRMQLIALY